MTRIRCNSCGDVRPDWPSPDWRENTDGIQHRCNGFGAKSCWMPAGKAGAPPPPPRETPPPKLSKPAPRPKRQQTLEVVPEQMSFKLGTAEGVLIRRWRKRFGTKTDVQALREMIREAAKMIPR